MRPCPLWKNTIRPPTPGHRGRLCLWAKARGREGCRGGQDLCAGRGRDVWRSLVQFTCVRSSSQYLERHCRHAGTEDLERGRCARWPDLCFWWGRCAYIPANSNPNDTPAKTSVLVYDPTTDTWTAKADMPFERWAIVAGVVEGRIYLIGGSARPYSYKPYSPEVGSTIQRLPSRSGLEHQRLLRTMGRYIARLA